LRRGCWRATLTLLIITKPAPRPGRKSTGGNVNRPRAADDFATIRARMEELRRERAQALKQEAQQAEESVPGPRGLLRRLEGRPRLEHPDEPTSPPSRRYGSVR
jgi:hypothetical protein